jgi:sarcosine oxidase
MSKSFDVIVLGVGSMGSATCYNLAVSGVSVLGLEQFEIPHDQGSHAGQSRIIRKAYFEHPDYVPLLQRAYENWHAIENKTGSQVYFPTGLLYAGKSTDILIKGVRESATKYKINIESLSKSETTSRYPQFRIPEDYEVLFEPDAGFVTPERAISLFVEQAKSFGAQINAKEKVISWTQEAGIIKVITDKDSYTCKKLVITAGPWAGKMIPGLSSSLRVTRQVIAWVNPKQPKLFELQKSPCWMIDDDKHPGMYYGFPILSVDEFGLPAGMKLAYHYPGLTTDPDHVDRNPSKEEEQNLIAALDRYLPEAYSSTHVLKTCLYTNTPDEHFVIDFLPNFEHDVVIAAGFSGHGFKFVSVVGEILADLATNGKTDLPIGFLNAKRFHL